MKKIIIIFILVFISLKLFSQETIFDEKRTIYRSEISGAVFVHTSGWGLNFRTAKFVTAFKRKTYEFEITGIKHPKEYKTFNPYNENTKGYFFGKINTLTPVHAAMGMQKTLFSKQRSGGISVNMIYFVGLSLGIVKPVYLEIANPNISDQEKIITVERYNPEIHTIDKIYGRASTLKGIEQSKIFPGTYFKIGVNFDYSADDEIVKAIETGILIDAFYKTVPIMAKSRNYQLFLNFYVALIYGAKEYQ